MLLPFLATCSNEPLSPWTADAAPLALVPIADAGVVDGRGRFREIFCDVLQTRSDEWPDYRPCEEALTRVANEPQGTGKPVNMGSSRRRLLALIVPGVGWECIEGWLNIDRSMDDLLLAFGFEAQVLRVDGLSSTANNARQIRDAIVELPPKFADRQILMIGYSKGAPDVLEAVVSYPEVRKRVVAVLSAAGAIGGSPLANAADQKDLDIIRHFPDSQCSEGDGGAIDSLRPNTRRAWLADHKLPTDIAYYSLVTYPHPERMSSVLRSSFRKLGEVDTRNDSQLIYYDQVIPGSTLLAFLNADHWAIAVPIARRHKLLGSTFVDKNDYPREALTEAVLRFVDEDLDQRRAGAAD